MPVYVWKSGFADVVFPVIFSWSLLVVTTDQSFNKLDPIDYYVQYDTDDIVE